MGLSDLQVFNEYTYLAQTEVLRQQVELFNAATRGALVLQATNHAGDFSEAAFYAKIQGLVRRRNAYAEGDVAQKNLEHLLDTGVKVAAGTPPVRVDPAWWNWIQRSPEEAGAVYGRQLAVDTLADMLNTAVLALGAALVSETDVVHESLGANATYGDLLKGTSKFGDRSTDLACWITHSKVMFDIWGQNLTNQASLFNFGTVSVITDGFGRPIVLTDSPALYVPGGQPYYHSLCLVPGAATVGMNNDFFQNEDTTNGGENIERTLQSEWSYNLGIKGFSWDKSSGGASPNDMALGSSANWDRYATDKKDLAGVLVKTR